MHREGASRILEALGRSVDETQLDNATDLARLLADNTSSAQFDTLCNVVTWGMGLVGGALAPGTLSEVWLRHFVWLAGLNPDNGQRYLFARALAHEVLRPGTIHIRTLHVLAQLDEADLALLQRLARLVCVDFIVQTDEHFLESRDFGLSHQDRAQEAGLLLSDAGRAKVFFSQVEDRFLCHVGYRDQILRVEHPMAQQNLTLPCLRLTRSGADLCRIAVVEDDFDYLLRINHLIRNLGYKVSQAAVAGRDPDPNILRHHGFVEIVPLRRS